MSEMASNAELATDDRASIGKDDWGVVLLAHGSQRGADRSECSCSWASSDKPLWCRDCPNTPQGLQEAADRLRAQLGFRPDQVVLSCLEFIQPNPVQAVHLLEQRGYLQVALMPFLLGRGKHATLELDELVEALQDPASNLQVNLAEGLGTDPCLVDLVVERVQGDHTATDTARENGHITGVLLVKAGTKTEYDDCKWLEELARDVEEMLGPGYAVAAAQSHYGDPTMESAAQRLVADRGASSLTCVPYLFFPGLILKRNVLGGMDRLRQQYPDLAMAITPPLGVDDRVVGLTAKRVRELWARLTTG